MWTDVYVRAKKGTEGISIYVNLRPNKNQQVESQGRNRKIIWVTVKLSLLAGFFELSFQQN